jgi:poly(3-hydroxybutyrate) depolymerase
MIKKLICLLALLLMSSAQLYAQNKKLVSGEYFVIQSWSQEKDFKRLYYVRVPYNMNQQQLPVLIFLHGNGGNAEAAMNHFLKHRKTLAEKYITVFANGYKKSWNIVSERSKADDLGFIEEIVQKLATYNNVQHDNFSIMGSSNGAALVNQIAIESKLANIRNYISGVSPLNVFQHDGKNFKAKGAENNYQTISKPMAGKRLLNISGTEDELVPYRGGLSKYIPAKNTKLGFVDAEQSIFLWARHMGYQGKKLANPSRLKGKLAVFDYLNTSVVHYKVIGEGHNVFSEISNEILLDFLENKGND